MLGLVDAGNFLHVAVHVNVMLLKKYSFADNGRARKKQHIDSSITAKRRQRLRQREDWWHGLHAFFA